MSDLYPPPERPDMSSQEQAAPEPAAKGWRGFIKDTPPPQFENQVRQQKNGDVVVVTAPVLKTTVKTNADGTVSVTFPPEAS